MAIEWVLLLYMNGYTIEHSTFKTLRECDSHLRTINAAFKQSQTKGDLRCAEKENKPKAKL